MRTCMLLVAVGGLLTASEQGTKVEYVGGTIGDIKPGGDLRLFAGEANELAIIGKTITARIPYVQINQIEYGQKIGRNVLAAITISPLFLITKTRKHFLTLGYTDGFGNQQAVVMRVEKGDIRAVLASLEARTGLKVTYLDDEARKM